MDECAALNDLTNDQLDAIASHAGVLALVLERVDGEELMPFFVAELLRLEQQACDRLVERGVISELFIISGDVL